MIDNGYESKMLSDSSGDILYRFSNKCVLDVRTN